jgi:phytoene dehydrogenase-like protein
LARREIPQQPFLLLGQMTTADSSRSPAGTESAWAYTHLPEGVTLSADDVRRHTDLIESVVERNAPGFRDTILARSVQAPLDLQSADANLHGGAINGGTAGIHQQLIFRPLPGLGRAETPIDGLYLASASAHPGGGVHGGPGSNAARAALSRHHLLGTARRRILDGAFRRIYT